MLNEQTRHLAHVVRRCRERAATYVEPAIEAEEEWCATMRRLAVANEGYLLECTPGYVNQEGRPSSANSLLSSQYGEGPEAFFALLRAWRDEGSMKGLELRCGPS
jgi:cyclohexanone monooxygenase